jgi:hypothetical protein
VVDGWLEFDSQQISELFLHLHIETTSGNYPSSSSMGTVSSLHPQNKAVRAHLSLVMRYGIWNFASKTLYIPIE